VQVITETLPALQKLKEQGLVRFIGITGLPLKIFQTVLDRWADNFLFLVAMQSPAACHACQ
jgi:diketogulonate reductase-like aldo/keto reductase